MESASVPSIFPFDLVQERRSRKQSPSSRHSSVKKLGRGPRHSLPDERNSSIDARAWAEAGPVNRWWEPSEYIYIVHHNKLAGRVLPYKSLCNGQSWKRQCEGPWYVVAFSVLPYPARQSGRWNQHYFHEPSHLKSQVCQYTRGSQ